MNEIVKHAGGRPPKWTEADIPMIDAKIDEYFAECENKGEPITITGLAIKLDCDMETIRTYKEKPEFSISLKRAYNKCFDYIYKGMLTARNPAGYIFAAKNYGMSDSIQLDVTSKLVYELPDEVKLLTK